MMLKHCSRLSLQEHLGTWEKVIKYERRNYLQLLAISYVNMSYGGNSNSQSKTECNIQ